MGKKIELITVIISPEESAINDIAKKKMSVSIFAPNA